MEEERHVLIVEDEVIIALDIKQCLESFGYVVDEVADSADDAMFYVKKYAPDIVLMDIKLQGSKDGTSIVPEIQTKYNIPVVYLTSHTDKETLKIAASTNPYGYVVKPFDETQLSITLSMALSRFHEENRLKSENEYKTIKINKKYRYVFDTKKLYYEDNEINFTKKEAEFIYVLAKNLDSVVSSEAIIKELWDDDSVPQATLRSLVRRVRDKIKDDLIESAVSLGYKLKSKLDDEKR
jgi:DNA-binding response OmpR family regulator